MKLQRKFHFTRNYKWYIYCDWTLISTCTSWLSRENIKPNWLPNSYSLWEHSFITEECLRPLKSWISSGINFKINFGFIYILVPFPLVLHKILYIYIYKIIFRKKILRKWVCFNQWIENILKHSITFPFLTFLCKQNDQPMSRRFLDIFFFW